MKIDQIKQEIEYREKIFGNVRMRFMNAIDHMDYHPSQTNNQDNTESIERKKRSIILQETGQYIPNAQTLSQPMRNI